MNYLLGYYQGDAEKDEAMAYGLQEVVGGMGLLPLREFEDAFRSKALCESGREPVRMPASSSRPCPPEIQRRLQDQIWDPTLGFSIPGRLTGVEISWRNYVWQAYSKRLMTSDDYLDIASKTGVKASCSGLKLTYDIMAGCCLKCPDLSKLPAFK